MSTVLITGGAGFVGTNVADRLLAEGRRVRILDDLSRPGVERNLAFLQDRHGERLEVEVGDVCDRGLVRRALRRVEHVFHFAAQVAVTTSLEEPARDAEVNLQGTLNLLLEARARPRPPAIVFTSTNKVYGALEDVELVELESRYEPVARGHRGGVDERRPLSFCTPYGCSKGAADQYVCDWHASYGVPTVVFRMSCIYGPHQQGTEDQGWVAHFAISALAGEAITVYGDGKQVRDVLYVEDLVDALLVARERSGELAGRAFNIGGGPANAVSLLELIELLERAAGEPLEVRHAPWRPQDQRWYVSDAGAFTRATGWRPRVGPEAGVERLTGWLSRATSAREVVA